jgi:Family of unknown function (DUF5899)
MELAIPMIAAGGLYVLSKHKQKSNGMTESFKNKHLDYTEMSYPNNQYPNSQNNINYYPHPNSAMDKYFQPPKGSNELVQSISGKKMPKNEFIVNGMVSNFGRQKNIGNYDEFDKTIAAGKLDHYISAGHYDITKTETAPLFKPEINMEYANGTPNQSDFIQSRMNPSMAIKNVKPFESQMVGPGLNMGYGTQGSGGYNSGMEARELWRDKTVNELRVETNPRVTYSLNGHEGPSETMIKTKGSIGKVEKYHPDAFYVNTPDRYFTNVGDEKAPTLHNIQPESHSDRGISQQNYTGVSNGESRPMQHGLYHEGHRQQFTTQMNMTPARTNVDGNNLEVRQSNVDLPNNARSSNQQPESFGIATGLIHAITAPLMDVLRPSRKENTIHSLRSGNPTTSVPSTTTHYQNKIAPTIRDTTQYSPYQLGQRVTDARADGYKIASYDPVYTQRDTTTTSYIGNSSASNPAQMYMGTKNTIETNRGFQEGQMNHGNTNQFNSHINMESHQRLHSSYIGNPIGSQTIPNMNTHGSINMPSYTEKENDRLNPDLLQAFKNNPYTHSLQSVV